VSRAPHVPEPLGLGRDTRRRAAARAALAAVLFDRDGQRRLPGQRQLRRAIDACDRRDVWWVCEMNSVAPVYFLPPREWVRALGAYLDRLGVRVVLEVGAGDGFLSRALAAVRPRLRVIATDNGAWAKPAARMSRAERRAYTEISVRGVALGPGVHRVDAVAAVRRYRPDLVLVSWPPPGSLVERLIRVAPGRVLEIGADGDVCGAGPRTWRFAEELVDGPLERLAFCRLDERSDEARRTRVTLYRGAGGSRV
jgi:hypothetical protein